jgi:uncharacterized protein
MMGLNEVIQAAKDGNAPALKQLLAADRSLANGRADSGETPLMAAIYRGHSDVVELLLKAGAGRDIFSASAVGNMEALEQALAADPASVSSVAYDGWTPLHLAAFFGRTAAAERLLAAGADLNAVSSNSLHNTPLHAAVAGGHLEVALWLIESGAAVNSSDAGGHTPLHIAAEAGYVPVVEALLSHGANPHIVDAEDRTPLARAAARNHHEVVDLINVGNGPG